jgi:ABC-type glycerol-3-phosphate transport system permease component
VSVTGRSSGATAPAVATAISARLGQRDMTRLAARGLEAVGVYAVFVIVIVFFLTPFAWLFLAAFDAKAGPFIHWPDRFTLDNFAYIFRELDFARAIGNSMFIATATMLLDVLTVSLAAYAISRLQIRRKDWLMYALLLLQTMPITATMVPIYGLARQLGLRNSYLGLILVHAALDLPFLIWLLKGFFDTVPRYLEEAAWLDGRSKLRALFEIVLPVAAPGLAVVAGLSFLNAWSEVLMVLILVDRPDMMTVPLAFYQTFRSAGGYTEVRYELIAAMGLLYLLPVMLLFIVTRNFLVRGMTSTTKGL